MNTYTRYIELHGVEKSKSSTTNNITTTEIVFSILIRDPKSYQARRLGKLSR